MSSICSECRGVIPTRRRGTCSAECKRVAKRRSDRERYQSMRLERIAQARAWAEANAAHKRQYDAAYRERTREARLATKRAWSRAYHLSNPDAAVAREGARRARKLGAGCFRISDRDRRRALHRHRHACASCKRAFTALNPLEWDHVVPLARGGRHSIGNLLPLCRACNRSKSVRFWTEWRVGRVVSLRVITPAI